MRVSRTMLGALCAGLLVSVAGQVKAGTATFDFFNAASGNHPDVFAEMTLTSSLITGPANPREPYTFNFTPEEIAAAGETVLGDLTAFSLSFDGHTLTEADITSIASGWSASANSLTSPFSASHTFADGTVLNLKFTENTNWVVSDNSYAAPGGWLLQSVTPVPVPAAAWLLLSGLGAVGTFLKRRRDAYVPVRSSIQSTEAVLEGLLL